MHVQPNVAAVSRRRHRLHALSIALAYCCANAPALAVEAPAKRVYEFNAGYFPGSSRVDLSQFNQGNVVLPGTYQASVVVNGQEVGSESLRFEAPAPGQSAQFCLDRKMLERFGLDMERVEAARAERTNVPAPALDDAALCRSIEDWVPEASVRFDEGEQMLSVQVPQLYMSRRPRGQVSAEQLDSGVTAAMLNYDANLYDNRAGGVRQTNGYLGLRAGFNIAGWLLRHDGSLAWDGTGGNRYQAGRTYAQHDVISLQSQFTMGQLYTHGDLFGSVRLRGVELATDDRMLPQSMVGYAPVVRGIADSNALVRILQRGVVLRELTVAPGPFEIEDLNATGFGGDLDVVVREADGREKTFTVPFSGTAQLLRPGYSRYAVSAGYVDSAQYAYQPYLIQAQLQHGLNNMLTGYAGVLKSEHYASAQLGASLNLPVGALSLDVTQARLVLPGQRLQGQSVQFRYSKQFGKWTNIAFGAYRYSTRGYVGVNEALGMRGEAERDGTVRDPDRYRSRLDATLRQSLGAGGGQLYATASSQDFWNRGGRVLSYSLGYNNRWRMVAYGLNAQRSTNLFDQRSDNEFSLTVSLPLGHAPRAPNLYSTLRQDRNGDTRVDVGLSGTLGDRREMQYGLNTSQGGGASSFGASGQYSGPWAALGGSYSQGNSQRSASFDVSGGVLVHGGGVTFAPTLGETIGLVHAPDAAGAQVDGGDGARVDARGYALVPALNPYRFNTVELDPRGTSSDVQLKTTTRTVAPRAGAVVWLDYPADKARAVLIKARRTDGSPLPFAASVFDAYGNSVGNVGQGSRVQLRSDEAEGLLTVRWGKLADQQCQLAYQLPARSEQAAGLPDLIDRAVCVDGPQLAATVPVPRVSAAPAQPATDAATRRGETGLPRGRSPQSSLPSLSLPGVTR